MKGWVYIFTNDEWRGLVKIGFSTKDPGWRVKDFSTGSPCDYVVQYHVLVEEPRRIEKAVHRLLAAKRRKREWFTCGVAEAINVVREACQGSAIVEFVNPDADLAVRRRLKRRRVVTAATILLLGAGAFWVWNTTHQDSESISSPSLLPAIVTPKTPSPAPLNTPAVAAPKQAPRFATVADAQREALRRYPDLGVADSRFNRAFLARHKQYQQERPDYFRDPSWPFTLAEETAKELKPK